MGLVTGACLAELGNTLYCVDTDAAKIASLQDNQIPMYEPGLQDLVERNQAAGRLHFTTSLAGSGAIHRGGYAAESRWKRELRRGRKCGAPSGATY